MVIWSVVSASPGYAYVFGEGTIALNDSSFEIVFDEPPPPQALNWSGTAALGVGIVIITTDQNLMSRSTLPETYSNAGVLGASGRYGLIYIQGSFEAFTEGGWWDNSIRATAPERGWKYRVGVFLRDSNPLIQPSLRSSSMISRTSSS